MLTLGIGSTVQLVCLLVNAKCNISSSVVFLWCVCLQGAQIFEAVGLDQEVIDLCFEGTASRIGGVTFQVLGKEVGQRLAF